MVKEEFAAWERSHGFDSDRFLKAEPSRIGEAIIKRKPVMPVAARDPELLSRAQWFQKGRSVLANDSESMRTVTARSGHVLHLFALHQTRARKQ